MKDDKTCKDCAYFENKPGFFIDYSTCLKHKNNTKAEYSACKDFVAKKDPHAYRRGGLFGYHIATFICNVLGKELNDSVYLSVKALRDEFLEKDSKYDRVLEEYDTIGPLICHYINMEECRDYIAHNLYTEYLTPCAQAWDNNEPERALRIYLTMLNALKKKYGLGNHLNESTENELNRTSVL